MEIVRNNLPDARQNENNTIVLAFSLEEAQLLAGIFYLLTGGLDSPEKLYEMYDKLSKAVRSKGHEIPDPDDKIFDTVR